MSTYDILREKLDKCRCGVMWNKKPHTDECQARFSAWLDTRTDGVADDAQYRAIEFVAAHDRVPRWSRVVDDLLNLGWIELTASAGRAARLTDAGARVRETAVTQRLHDVYGPENLIDCHERSLSPRYGFRPCLAVLSYAGQECPSQHRHTGE